MSKYCASCGAEINEGEAVCPLCGAACEENEQNTPEKESAPVKAKKKKLDAKRIVGLAIVLIALVIIVVTVVSAVGNFIAGIGPKSAMNKVFDVTFENKSGKIEACAPEEYWDTVKDSYGLSVKDVKDYYEDMYIDTVIDDLEDECGKDLKVKYKFTDADELSERKLDSVRNYLKTTYGILRKDVTKGYEYDVEIKVTGSEDYYKTEGTLIVVKIDGKWYVFTENGQFFIEDLVSDTYESTKNESESILPEFDFN